MLKPTVQLTPYLIQPPHGQPVPTEWGYLTVAENRHADQARPISIPFIRVRGQQANIPPVFNIQGGPGYSILPLIGRAFGHPYLKPPTQFGDVIYIEQRGYGLSRPNLAGLGTYSIPPDQPGSPELYSDSMRTYLTRAYEFWHKAGVDLHGYNVLEMAADIEELRQALGYEKISLVGGSFGSHHSLAVLKRFGQNVHRAVLSSIEGPNHTMKLPGNIQHHLEMLSTMLDIASEAGDGFPDLLDLMGEVLERLENKPAFVDIKIPESGDEVRVGLGRFDLQLVISNGLGSTRFLSQMPARFMQLARGDYTWLGRKVVQERTNLDPSLMFAIVDFASGATPERRAQIRKEASNTLLGSAINDPFLEFDDIFGDYDLGNNFRTEFSSQVPTMLVSGSLDFRTPPSNAAELLPGLPNHIEITVEGASHDLTWRGDHLRDLATMRDQFLLEKVPSKSRLTTPLEFQTEQDLNRAGN